MATMRFCPRCGAQPPADANFCPSCGNDLRVARTQPGPTPAPQPGLSPQPAPNPQPSPPPQPIPTPQPAPEPVPQPEPRPVHQSGWDAPPPPLPPQPAPAPRVRTFEQEQRLWAALTHLSAFAGFFLPFVGNIIGPIVVWVLKKDEMPLVDTHGKAAINFNISVVIYGIVSFLLIFVLIGFLLLPALIIFWVIMVIVAAIRANDGRDPGYPLTIDFIH